MGNNLQVTLFVCTRWMMYRKLRLNLLVYIPLELSEMETPVWWTHLLNSALTFLNLLEILTVTIEALKISQTCVYSLYLIVHLVHWIWIVDAISLIGMQRRPEFLIDSQTEIRMIFSYYFTLNIINYSIIQDYP